MPIILPPFLLSRFFLSYGSRSAGIALTNIHFPQVGRRTMIESTLVLADFPNLM